MSVVQEEKWYNDPNSRRFACMCFLTGSFMFVELSYGIITNSLALVSDAFHMMSDLLAMIIGFYASRLMKRKKKNARLSYGYVRAEIIAALVNSVFLVSICLFIIFEAITRFYDKPDIKNSKSLMIVGGVGLAINILGLFIFGEHGHGHSHSGGHGHSHSGSSNSHRSNTHEGHDHSHGGSSNSHEGHDHSPASASHEGHDHSHGNNIHKGHDHSHGDSISHEGHDHSHGGSNSHEGHHHSHGNNSYEGHDHSPGGCNSNTSLVEMKADTNTSILISNTNTENYMSNSNNHPPSHQNGNCEDNASKNFDQSASKPKQNANIRAVYLHVLGDALGSVAVIVVGAFITYTDLPGRFYADPIVSLLISFLIIRSALPIIRDTTYILFQSVPPHININEIKSQIEKIDPNAIIGVHELHVWELFNGKLIASVHLMLNSNAIFMPLLSQLKEILHEHDIHVVTVQPEWSNADSATNICQLGCTESCADDICCETESFNMITEAGNVVRKRNIWLPFVADRESVTPRSLDNA